LESRKQYNPQMHSAEHILNQTMVRMYNCNRSFSKHIEKKKSKCNFHFERELTEKEIVEIQQNVNDTIQQDLPVVEEFISRDKTEEKYNLSRLPNEDGNTIRTINIGDYAACPCSGLHVSHTKEIRRFIILSTNFKYGVLRIRFKLPHDL